MSYERDTYEDGRKLIESLAGDAFRAHVLKQETPERWLCRRPERQGYWFRVIKAPTALMVYGDVGELVLRISDIDPIPWLRGAITSPEYLWEKVQASKEPTKTFYPRDAMRWLDDYLAESWPEDECDSDRLKRQRAKLVDLASELWEDFDHGDALTHERFYTALVEEGVDDVYSVGMFPTSTMLWLWHALCCFVRLLDAPPAEGDTKA